MDTKHFQEKNVHQDNIKVTQQPRLSIHKGVTIGRKPKNIGKEYQNIHLFFEAMSARNSRSELKKSWIFEFVQFKMQANEFKRGTRTIYAQKQ